MPTEYNQQMIDAMAAKFRRKYDPAHAFADAIGMLQMFPGVVGIWPGSVTDGAGQLIDISGNGNHLTNSSGVFTLLGLSPTVYYGGSARHYHTDASIFDIIGNESHLSASYRGLTIGGWAKFQNSASAFEVISGKWGAGGNSYKIQRSDTGLIQFATYDGATTDSAATTTVIGANQWVFICGRFIPSTENKVWANNETVTNTVSIPATLNNSSSTFTIGSQDTGTFPMTGWTFGEFLCAAAVLMFLLRLFLILRLRFSGSQYKENNKCLLYFSNRIIGVI